MDNKNKIILTLSVILFLVCIITFVNTFIYTGNFIELRKGCGYDNASFFTQIKCMNNFSNLELNIPLLPDE